MSNTRLAAIPPSFDWSTFGWTQFPGKSADDRTLVVLPVHGLADHGIGLPLGTEETVGAAVLSTALGQIDRRINVRVLPPIRFALAPYPSSTFGIDAETAHDQFSEIAESVQNAGYSKLIFWNTSPWNSELIDAASRDIRVDLGMQTFIIESSGIGLGFHPADPTRAIAQSIGAHLQQCTPEDDPSDNPVSMDVGFRPGKWTSSPPIEEPTETDAGTALAKSAQALADLLSEIDARASLGSSQHRVPYPRSSDNPVSPCTSVPWSCGQRNRYLPAFTAKQIGEIQNPENVWIVIPVGAIEQHGPHLPVGVDSLIGQATCDALSAELPPDFRFLFAPPITYGKSNEHVGFPGTVSLTAKTLRRLAVGIVHQLHHLGFRRFAMLNTHGGNSSVLVYTIRELQALPDVHVGMLKVPSTEELSAQEAAWGFHAGEWETCIMLEIAPALVAMDRAVKHYPASINDPGRLRPENAPAIFSWVTRDIAPKGVMGDATAATAQKGKRWFAAAITELAGQIQRLP